MRHPQRVFVNPFRRGDLATQRVLTKKRRLPAIDLRHIVIAGGQSLLVTDCGDPSFDGGFIGGLQAVEFGQMNVHGLPPKRRLDEPGELTTTAAQPFQARRRLWPRPIFLASAERVAA